MILELTGSRLLAPHLGTSLMVWTSLIGVILGCLALGYWQGGRLADRRPSRRGLCVIILLASMAVSGIALIQGFVLPSLGRPGLELRVAAVAATVVLFAPASVLLGMVSPYAVRLKLAAVGESGRTVGRLYALSTLGSIVGTFAAGFVLIALLGSTQVVVLMAAVLLGAGLLLAERPRPWFWLGLAALLLALAWGFGHAQARRLAARGVQDVDTAYNRVFVQRVEHREYGPITVLSTSPRFLQSAILPGRPEELILRYTRAYRLAPRLARSMRRMLIVGGAGYAVPRYFLAMYPNLEVDVAEIDPGMTELAVEHFGLDLNEPRLRVFHQDGRAFLNHAPAGRYDVILIDAFTNVFTVPFQLTTLEAVRAMERVLAPGGVVMTNLLSAVEGPRSAFYRAELATYRQVFSQVETLRIQEEKEAGEAQNLLLAAGREPLEPGPLEGELAEWWRRRIVRPVEAAQALTDERAPVDFYMVFVELGS